MDSKAAIRLSLFEIAITAETGFAGTICGPGGICRVLPGPGLAGSLSSPVEIEPRRAGNLDECPGAIIEEYNPVPFALAAVGGHPMIGSTGRSPEDRTARCSCFYAQGRLQDNKVGAESTGISRLSAPGQDTRDLLQCRT